MSKIAIITGGSRGLGRADALYAAKKGIDSIITYHSNKGKAEGVVTEVEKFGQKAVALQLDAASIASFDVFADQVKQVLKDTWNRNSFDFLVNNAGIGIMKPISEVTEADFDSLVNVHFKGVFFLTQKLLPVIADGGRIINVSSGLTRFTQIGSSIYASAKGAIEVLTRYLAKELGPRGISVITVAPGAIATDFGGGRIRNNKDISDFIASVTALGRVGEADDIGGVIASLLTEDMRWINGTRVEVSGGMWL
jgi:NAD(P)-dependent dehydrogenase (short-subunit alcohol dehydrogenase family)